MTTKAISIQQPWAWLIVNGHKPLENRSWATKYRGPLFIHASLTFDRKGYDWVRENFPEIEMPAPDDFPRGGIVGCVTVTDMLRESESPWFSGPIAWLLEIPAPSPLIPCKGRLGLFTPPGIHLELDVTVKDAEPSA